MLEGAWGIFIIIGVIVLGAVILYALYRNNQHETPAEIEQSERGSRDLYDDESAREIEEERREASLGRRPGGPDPRLDDPTVEGQDVRRD